MIYKINAHDDYVNCIIQLSNGILCSASHDKKIKCWNIESSKCIKIIDGHNGWVMSLSRMKHEGSILSTSGDKTIKIFNIITGECDITFKGHSDYVRTAIELIDTRIISGSDDKSIRIWDSKTGELDLKIENHTGWIRSIIQLKGGIDDGKIASCSDDSTIRIFNLNGVYERVIVDNTPNNSAKLRV